MRFSLETLSLIKLLSYFGGLLIDLLYKLKHTTMDNTRLTRVYPLTIIIKGIIFIICISYDHIQRIRNFIVRTHGLNCNFTPIDPYKELPFDARK